MRDSPRTTRYRLVVRGDLGSVLSSVFDGASIQSAGGLTTLAFDVRDSSHLSGILDRLRDLAVDVVSAEVVPEPAEQAKL